MNYMFGGLGGMNPKQMAGLMKQMGINSEQLEAEKVVIELKDGRVIVVENPNVMQIEMKGEKSFQISGKILEEKTGGQKEKSDVDIIVEETGVSKEEAEKALENAKGDLAEAILKLKA